MREGDAQLAKGDYGQAWKALEEARKRDRNSPEAIYKSAFAYFNLAPRDFYNSLAENGVRPDQVLPPGVSGWDVLTAQTEDMVLSSNIEKRLKTKYSLARSSAFPILGQVRIDLEKALKLRPNCPEAQQLLERANALVAPPTVKSGGCFIATACYGDYNHPDVLVLRRFRDERLLGCRVGAALVSLYYQVSPTMAERLQRVPWLRAAFRRWVLEPLARKLGG